MKRMRIVWITVYFLLPIVPVALILQTSTFYFRNAFMMVSMVTGVFAYVWLVNQFILSARPKFIERYFGMDRLYRFHNKMAVVSFFLALAHSQIKERVFGLEILLSEIALILFGAIIVFSLLFLGDSFLRKWQPVRALRKFSAEKLRLKFKVVRFFHNFTLVAAGLLAFHVNQSSAARASLPVRIFYTGYFALAIGFYVYHKFIKPMLLRQNAFEVIDNVKEAPDVQTLKLGAANGEVFGYKPGQFVFVTILDKEIGIEEHPFSLSSAPGNRDFITLTIKGLGDFTSRIREVKTGTRVLVDGPYGYFSMLNHDAEADLVFIAGGIGITPILSMLMYLKENQPDRNVLLLWGAQQPVDLVRLDEVEALQKEMPNFEIVPFVERGDDWKGQKGFITREYLTGKLFSNGSPEKQRDFYVCGPPIMMEIMIGHLKSLGVEGGHIHFERFAL